jgi:hypothetical protein
MKPYESGKPCGERCDTKAGRLWGWRQRALAWLRLLAQRRRCRSSYNSSATLSGDSRTSSAKGAFGRHPRHESLKIGRYGRVVMPVEPSQVDAPGGAAGRATDPQEPMAGGDGSADLRREQRRHVSLLPRVPGRDQVFSVSQYLRPEPAARLGLLGRFGGALALHPALVEANGQDSAAGAAAASSPGPMGRADSLILAARSYVSTARRASRLASLLFYGLRVIHQRP